MSVTTDTTQDVTVITDDDQAPASVGAEVGGIEALKKLLELPAAPEPKTDEKEAKDSEAEEEPKQPYVGPRKPPTRVKHWPEATKPQPIEPSVHLADEETGDEAEASEPQALQNEQPADTSPNHSDGLGKYQDRVSGLEQLRTKLREQYKDVLEQVLEELKEADASAAHTLNKPVDRSFQYLQTGRNMHPVRALGFLERKLLEVLRLLEEYAPILREQKAREIEELEAERLRISRSKVLMAVLHGFAQKVLSQPIKKTLRSGVTLESAKKGIEIARNIRANIENLEAERLQMIEDEVLMAAIGPFAEQVLSQTIAQSLDGGLGWDAVKAGMGSARGIRRRISELEARRQKVHQERGLLVHALFGAVASTFNRPVTDSLQDGVPFKIVSDRIERADQMLAEKSQPYTSSGYRGQSNRSDSTKKDRSGVKKTSKGGPEIASRPNQQGPDDPNYRQNHQAAGVGTKGSKRRQGKKK